MLTRPAPAPALRPRGISIVETMVGLAVGMVLMAGALRLYVDNLANSRRLLAEVRLTQDLRAAAELVARDLRRAGYWGHALQGTQAIGSSSAVAANPYAAVSGGTSDGLRYSFSRDGSENDTLDDAEQFGFRVHSGSLQMQTASGQWQDITDTRSMRLADNGLEITASETTLPLGHLCSRTCDATTPGCPVTQLRSYRIVLSGGSVSDADVRRQFTSTVRVRNDRLSGQCPA